MSRQGRADGVAVDSQSSEQCEHAVLAASRLNFEQAVLETNPGLQIKLSTIPEHCHISPALIFLVFGLGRLAFFNAAIYRSVNFSCSGFLALFPFSLIDGFTIESCGRLGLQMML